jgi:hypothetical protein
MSTTRIVPSVDFAPRPVGPRETKFDLSRELW